MAHSAHPRYTRPVDPDLHCPVLLAALHTEWLAAMRAGRRADMGRLAAEMADLRRPTETPALVSSYGAGRAHTR
jgi:hypothetical protein